MRPAPRRAALGVASLLGACVYLNSLYNAQSLFDQAERASWAGRDEDARPLYDSVVAKAARSYRAEPTGTWADDALYLLGRAYLRRGESDRAEAALRRVVELSDDGRILAGARLHLGIAVASAGDRSEALALLDDALRAVEEDASRAEGYLWRARLLARAGRIEAGGRDLERAEETDARYRVPAGFERLRWALDRAERGATGEAVDRLLRLRDAHVREDSLRAMIGRAAGRWGPGFAAELLADAEESAWPAPADDRLLLDRARYRLASGEEERAVADATAVAHGVGVEATEARLLLAGILCGRARRVEDLEEARAALLPAVGDPRALELLEAIRMVEILVERARDEGPPEALFAAGELARDAVGARGLARALLLRYADVPDRVWSGKALLAALDLTDEPTGRPPLLRLLARMRNDPYVSAAPATGRPPALILELDTELQEVLAAVLAGAAEQARQRDVLARERADTVR